MKWLIAGLILGGVAVLLRRLLRLDAAAKSALGGRQSLRADLQAIFQPLAQEVEAHTTILGITLNDGFSERQANRQETAWQLVRLAGGEWDRLTELLVGLQGILSKFLPTTNGVVPVRRVATTHFKSRALKDYVGLYDFLDKVLFSSKARFALQMQLLGRATATLSKEFRRASREGERTLDASEELWTRLDHNFHDFDLIAKETLLALRILLACQSPEGARRIGHDIQALLDRGVRVSLSASNQ